MSTDGYDKWSVREVIEFLEDNEQYGDDWSEQKKGLNALLAEVKRLQKRNEWLEEVVALAQEHGAIDLSDYGWPRWEEEE